MSGIGDNLYVSMYMSNRDEEYSLWIKLLTLFIWIEDSVQKKINNLWKLNLLYASSGQSIGVSVSASVLPMNIQDWFPLGWTGWISLQSKGLSRVFSNTQFKSTNSWALSFLYSPTLTSIHDHWENHSLD